MAFVKHILQYIIVCNIKICYSSAMDRKTQLLEAATKVFFKYGASKARFGDIAKEAGVSRPTLYAAFEDKDAILVATIHHVAQQFVTTINNQIADKVTMEERLALFTRITVVEPYQLIQKSKDAADILTGHNEAGRQAIRETLELKSILLMKILAPFFNDAYEEDVIVEQCRTFVHSSSGLKNTVADDDELQKHVAILSAVFLDKFSN